MKHIKLFENFGEKTIQFRDHKGSKEDSFASQKESKVNEEFETDDISQSLSDWWIPCDEQLPENGQQVIIYTTIKGKSINICTFKRGISAKEREELKLSGDERWRSFSGADEYANNRKAYNWVGAYGPGSYFGQDVTHWMPIPDSPDSDYRV